MARCRQYWEIAERNSALFTQIQELRDAAAGGNVNDALMALQKQYKDVLTELDLHTSACPVCKALE